MVFSVAVIDDETSSAKTLKDMVKEYEAKHPDNQFRVDCFSDAVSFLDHYDSDYDIIFLDIQMPDMSGMEAARRIREKDDDVMLVFVTNMAQYALESYEVHAYDFVLKPLDYDSFSMKFFRICNSLRHRLSNASIVLASGTKKKKVRILDITYIEVCNHNLVVHLTGGEYSMRGTISEMERQLSAYHFVRCNSCYLVNLKHVRELRGDYIVVDKSELRISHLKKPTFLSEFAKYMGDSI